MSKIEKLKKVSEQVRSFVFGDDKRLKLDSVENSDAVTANEFETLITQEDFREKFNTLVSQEKFDELNTLIENLDPAVLERLDAEGEALYEQYEEGEENEASGNQASDELVNEVRRLAKRKFALATSADAFLESSDLGAMTEKEAYDLILQLKMLPDQNM